MPEARVLVLGAGAIGAFYGGVLARAGCEVSVVARSDFDAVAAGGFRIESALGELSFRPAQLLRAAGDYRGEADYLLVALKLVRGVDRPALIRPALAAGSAIVLVQNGIGIEDEIAQAFPRHELLSGVAYAGVSREAPGRVRHHSKFTRLVLGRYPHGASDKAARLAGLVQKGGASCVVSEDIAGARWEKCVWNAVFNPVSAIGGGLGSRDIVAGEEQAAFVLAAMAEVCALAAADGHPLAADLPQKLLEGTRKMPNHVSSMGQDRLAGRPMETEALLGNAVRIAHRLGVAVPRLETLYALLRMSEAKSGAA